ncbi:PulJ/GspJ family protein [Atopomonas sediminilitoris]|uniref:PulJ/GspJ family protein n=1 Tax=Atopomonas sediminilitoris TaxID=2919919 RepID=UPI001F4E659A|nr:type II secretion system protein [Atopomonas sediminilitoris]MCJ8168412.1 type II secretion system GspH family protein [Atopomonas sediminilitoris]
MTKRRAQRAFTLVELVMVIALAGVVAVMISTVLSRPLEGLLAQSQRSELVDLAASALNRIARDIRLAVPNSVRVQGSNMDMLNVLDAGRYRPNRVGGDSLRFASGSDPSCSASGSDCSAFQVLSSSVSLAGARWLVLYNIGAESGGAPVAGNNVWAYANPGVISPTGTTFASSALAGQETLITLNNYGTDFRFALASPERRFYLADQVVGYRCSGNQLLRYTRNDLTPAFTGNAEVLVDKLSACSFNYVPGTPQRAGLVTLRLAMTINGETLELLQQVHVDNAP